MSLESLRTLRRNGGKPDAVRVLVGSRPKWMPDGPDLVVIHAQDDLRNMDLRPLVGMRVTVVELDVDSDKVLATAKAVLDAGATLVGAVCSAGAVGVSPEHEASMVRYRENACR